MEEKKRRRSGRPRLANPLCERLVVMLSVDQMTVLKRVSMDAGFDRLPDYARWVFAGVIGDFHLRGEKSAGVKDDGADEAGAGPEQGVLPD